MVHKFRFLTAFAGLFLFIAGGLFAQTPRELRFGTAVPGHLSEGEEQWFSVRATEAGFVVVETTGITDTYLEAYDADRNLIDENDDGGEDNNARLEIFAEAGKNYLFKLRGYDEEEGGPYSIRASFEAISGERELRPGTWVSGNLGGGENHLYSFRPATAGAVVVETSGDLDTILRAYEASQGYIASDDDSGEDYNARLEVFVEAGKQYLFRVGSYYGGRTGGPYSVRATFEAVPPDTERNTERSRAVPIKIGEAVQVFFRSTSESRWYRYDIPRLGSEFVVQTRGTMDTYMVLYNAQGDTIAEDDDSGEGFNAFISAVGLGYTGTVYIEVKPYSKRTGRCTLHAEIR
jgi:hypothetical protein